MKKRIIFSSFIEENMLSLENQSCRRLKLSDAIITTTTLVVPDGMDVGLKDKIRVKVNYHRVGNGATNMRSGLKSIDILDEIENMTKAEIKVINILKRTVPWQLDKDTDKYFTDGVSYVHSTYFKTKADKLSFNRGLKLLKDKDLAKKIGPNTYMLNPLAIIPTRPLLALEIWDETKTASISYDPRKA